MPNLAYLNVWCRDFPEDQIVDRLDMFLATVPYSSKRPGIGQVVVRAIDASESPILEQDFGSFPLDPAGALDLVRGHVHSDCSYEMRCYWDLATFDAPTAKFMIEPQPLEIVCNSVDYDDGIWRENGHFQVSLGFERLFTGYGGRLGSAVRAGATPTTREEAQFVEAMAWPENMEKYQEKTRQNIRKLLEWCHRAAQAVPVERLRVWSEGEEDLESRMDEILALR